MSGGVKQLLACLLFAGSVPLAAENTALSKIRTLLVPMRGKPFDPAGPRGASPAFTEAKHLLREWIESKLRPFRDEDDAQTFARELNADIRSAKLSCNFRAVPPEKGCPDRGDPGYLGEVRIIPGEMLVVTTELGIVCGFDQSAYAYYSIQGQWKRFWQSETNQYVARKYVPLNFLGILLSYRESARGSDPNERLLLMLARDPAYCESAWYNVYYRVWRLRVDRPEAQLLLDGSEMANVGYPVDGVVTPDDVLIQYWTSYAYANFDLRPVTRHYILRNGKLEREAPFALSPSDFTDEWMRTDWATSSQWSSAGVNASTLQRMHRKENFEGGSYGNTVHCEKRPEHWQVELEWLDFDGKTMVDRKRVYFLVRWAPPFRFWMAGVSGQPWPGCTERDRAADERKTLFPIHLHERW
ncbi:MAG TPA: hypothetical protein VKT81_06385 [Bryobacteraceae bacterium]|nr:hypothetical protein [Bryobacteraceae bacterium]